MGRRFHGRPVKPTFDGPRVNHRIRVPTVRLIDEKGNQLGIVETPEAIEIAKERGLDLVEVAATARPPVCRIMDYGRFKYEAKKRQAEAKKRQTVIEVKEIKIRPKTDDHDIDFKMRKARQFLEEGNKVKVTVRFRGREIMYVEEECDRLLGFAERFADVAEVEAAPKREGRTAVMVIAPSKRTRSAKKKAATTPKAASPEPAAKAASPEPAATPKATSPEPAEPQPSNDAAASD